MVRYPDMSIDADTELLLGYLDGALSEPQREALDVRLAAEPALAAQLAELRELDGQFAALAQRDVMSVMRLSIFATVQPEVPI